MSNPNTPTPHTAKNTLTSTLSKFWLNYKSWGRATPSEYWYPVLFYFLVFPLIFAVFCIFSFPRTFGIYIYTIVGILWCLALIVPNFTLTARRLHDSGFSAWNLLWYFIPYIGGLIILVLLCMPRDPKNNKWGEYTVVKSNHKTPMNKQTLIYIIAIILGTIAVSVIVYKQTSHQNTRNYFVSSTISHIQKTKKPSTAKHTSKDIKDDIVIVAQEPKFRYPVHEEFDTKTKKDWAKSRVVLQAKQESWVQIKDARGISVFSRVLLPGDVYYVPLGDNYKATLGNAGNIDIWVNGNLLLPVGKINTRKDNVSMSPEELIKSFGLVKDVKRTVLSHH